MVPQCLHICVSDRAKLYFVALTNNRMIDQSFIVGISYRFSSGKSTAFFKIFRENQVFVAVLPHLKYDCHHTS
jgi:hypothetical protein